MQTGDARTITGSGFGSTGPTLIAWDTFEGGTNGNAVGSPEFGTYADSSQVTYSNTSPHTGTLCCKSQPTSGDNFRALEMTLGVGSSEKFYFSAWLKISGGTGGQKKLFQIWGDPYAGNYAPGIGVGSTGSYIAREDVDYLVSLDIPGNSVDWNGVWQRWEMICQQNSAGGQANGKVLVTVDGVALLDETAINCRRDSSRVWGPMYWMDGHTNSSTLVTYYSDEVMAQNGWARVVLGNANTYAGSSLTVPQRVTSWSASSIGYVVFKGALTGDDVWEFVIDDTNAVVKTTALSWTGDLLAGPSNLRWRPA